MKYIYLSFLMILYIQRSSAQVSGPGSLQLTSGVYLTNTGATFLVADNMNIVNNGNSILLSAGNTLKITGNSATTFSGSGNTSFYNLINDNINGTFLLNSTIALYNQLTINTGTLNSNTNLVLRSTATNTAHVATIVSGGITGNVLVERYIPANPKRAWRLLSIPDATTQTINAAWQNGQAPGVAGQAGYGTIITSNNGNASFDYQTPGNSMLTYNPSGDAWTGIANTTSSIATDNAYFLFIRGDRTATPSPSNTSITATTLSTLGPLKQGNYPSSGITVQASKFASIGNPYASQIDFRNVTKSGVDNTFYVWDPKLTGPFGVGGYQTLTYNGSNYIITPGGGSYGSSGSVMNTIESGQGFLVHGGGGGTISFTESCKSNGSSLVFRTDATPAESLITNLYSVDASGEALEDGTMSLFGNYSNSVDGMDALKLINFGLNLGIVSESKTLTVEKRQPLTAKDIISFSLTNTNQQQYRFELIANGLDNTGLSAWLVDKYLNINTPVDLNGTTSLSFAVNSDALSAAANRFSIVFEKPAIVPPAVLVYPNPVLNGLINVQFKNMPKGIYTIRIVNSLGQTVVTKQINHADGSSLETIRINKIKGAYMLEITKPDNSKQINKLIVN